jgi:hypothetical protein
LHQEGAENYFAGILCAKKGNCIHVTSTNWREAKQFGPAGPPSDLHRHACHSHGNGDSKRGTSRNPQTHPYLRKFVDQIQPRRRSKQGIRNSSGDRQRANNVRGIIPEIQERANKVRGIFTSKLRAAWRCFSRVAGG